MSLQITSAHKLADFKCDTMTLALVKGPVFGGGKVKCVQDRNYISQLYVL